MADTGKNAPQSSYGADQIHVLEGLEAVRKRPGMYIGTTGPEGLHHLVYEIVDNSIDEALAGHCSKVFVSIGEDERGQYVVVQDDGRGIPIDIHPQKKMPTVRVVMEVLHAGGKFGGGGYKVSGGLHGVGMSVVNALSKRMEVYVVRDGKKYGVVYEDGGKFVSDYLKEAPKSNIVGTYVKFYPDEQIFEVVDLGYDRLLRRLRQTAFLTPQVTIFLSDTRPGHEKQETLHYENGIKDYIKHMMKNEKQLARGSEFYASGESGGILVEAALTYTSAYNERIYCFTNNIYNPEGGTHLSGFRRALTRALNDFAKNASLFKKDDAPLSSDDVRDGLVAVISIKMQDPQFEGQTKAKLGSQQAQGAVESVVYDGLKRWLEENPAHGKAFVQKCLQTQRARMAAKRAKELVRQKTNPFENVLLGKLATCTSKEVEERELFIVEGDSAGGSAKQARDRRFQAVLPIKGKILNIEKASDRKVYENEEVKSLVQAIGTGIDESFDESSINYGKIIILSDADVDGSHIRTLLLTLFARKFQKLIVDGRIWIAQPPLYRVKTSSGDTVYAFDQKELQSIISRLKGGYSVSRFKGLGEMDPKELWETTMDPARRSLKQVYIEDFEEADSAISDLLGSRVEKRFKLIEEKSKSMQQHKVA